MPSLIVFIPKRNKLRAPNRVRKSKNPKFIKGVSHFREAKIAKAHQITFT
jgi:hypothetical protein